MTTRPGRRQRIRVTGVVQGVGFRPFVYGIALRFGLAGHVGNDSGGVFIEVEGPADNLNSFVEALRSEPPPLAHVERITVEEMQTRGDDDFVIVHSEAHPQRATLISPDLCTCDDCLRELTDPADRRYRYAFINCTNCGPRYTIIQDIPYDRPLTTMAAFPMCPTCQAEYDDPLDRRFHAQPNACPDCGPQIWLEEAGVRLAGDAIAAAQRIIADGGIVAIKGLGGFHLACDAANDNAVARLRERKHRPAKPFALMAPSVQQVRTFAHLDPAEEAALTSRERPILLLRKHEPNTLSARIAPGNATIGVMLPYTPLHFLLVTDRPFVMTSGNISGEPIVTDNDDARLKLGGLADAFLMHNRAIHTPCDDSVIRRFQGVDLPVRRSRGYAPFPIRLPLAAPPLLATGGELKATFCLAEGEKAFMSQHIGDMANLSTLDAFTHAADHMARLFRIEPEAIITDSHPGYLSNRWAHEQSTSVVEVQHHHAHIAAVMAEHSHPNEPVIGFAFDGTGYGTDGTIWGGEVLIADYGTFERAAYLKPVPLAGGDVSVQRPYRLAMSHLYAAGLDWDIPTLAICPPEERQILERQFTIGLNTVPTSSMGRLFDAVSALAGVCQHATYEAQAAIELESIAAHDVHKGYSFALDGAVIDPAPVIAAIVTDLNAGAPAPVIAAKFHNAVAAMIARVAAHLRDIHGVHTVAFSGGVFQNTLLLEKTRPHLTDFNVLTHRLVPPNDGGLALGQAAIGSHRLTR